MFYYIIPYLLLLFGSLLIRYYNFDKNVLRILLFSLLLPAILVVVLRGNIGTDTMQYLGHFKSLDYQSLYIHEYEPGFNILTDFINLFGFNDHIDVGIISALTFYFLYKSYSTSRENILIFIFIVFPIFVYDMTVNGLRYGLSFALSSLAIDKLYKKNFSAFVLLAFFAISIQYSSLAIIIIFLVFKLNIKYLIGLAIFIFLLVLFGVGFSDKMVYLLDKQDAYKDLVSPSITSGLVPLLLFLLLQITFFIFSSTERSNKILVLLLFFELMSFALAKISYAGLRFQMLFLFSLIILIKQQIDLIEKKNTFFVFIFCIGFFGFLSTMKNIVAKVEDVESPYIPYKFFWQEIE